jgi:hypothetical protein
LRATLRSSTRRSCAHLTRALIPSSWIESAKAGETMNVKVDAAAVENRSAADHAAAGSDRVSQRHAR